MSSHTTAEIEPPAGSEQIARRVCEEHGDRPDELLEIFHAIQHELGWVPGPALPVVAQALNLSRAEVYGVLSFYHEFRRTPAGRHVVKICQAEACKAMHTDKLCAHAEQKLGARFGETSLDGRFTLEPVYCLGNCALSPAMMIGTDLYGCVDNERFDAIVDGLDREAAA